MTLLALWLGQNYSFDPFSEGKMTPSTLCLMVKWLSEWRKINQISVRGTGHREKHAKHVAKLKMHLLSVDGAILGKIGSHLGRSVPWGYYMRLEWQLLTVTLFPLLEGVTVTDWTCTYVPAYSNIVPSDLVIVTLPWVLNWSIFKWNSVGNNDMV